MSNRKRINISISEALFNDVEQLATAGGFKGSCAFLVALVEAFANYSKQRRKDKRETPKTITEEVAEMFAAKAISKPVNTQQWHT